MTNRRPFHNDPELQFVRRLAFSLRVMLTLIPL
jgi:hypothetical protein